MPTKTEESSLEFWNGTAQEYKQLIEKQLEDSGISDYWIKKILYNSPKKNKLRILDVGTGPGFFTINLTRLGHDVIGIDVSYGMILAAQQNAEAEGVDCRFMLMNANDLLFPDGSFDVIISRNVSWTLPDMFECYREWRRVLDSDGKIILFDSNHYMNVFSKEHARQLRRRMREHVSADMPPYSDYFDFHVRWTYWEERPMVGTPRPEWDMNMLRKLRFLDISSETDTDREASEPGTSTRMFTVTARKPSPEEENDFIVNEYWDGIAGCVSGRTVRLIDSGLADRYVDAIACHIRDCKTVLDVGAGSGIISIPLARRGYTVTAIDRSEGMIDMLELTVSEYGADIKAVNCDAENLCFDPDSFDSIILRNVLWNSYNPERILKEVVRVLKPDGVLLITDGNWLNDIEEWERFNPDNQILPNHKKRDLGLGARDVIEAYYRKLPLNRLSRPRWDVEILTEAGMVITYHGEFSDPAITDDLKAVLKDGF
ncbi:MAG: methyltransferase domain-containing protein, partial [Candidatus Methanomethylophilaceae archaeon]|nr:methyltransferase domain-containing protein [Candidatus Methanomethylophilaceae archaeon]